WTRSGRERRLSNTSTTRRRACRTRSSTSGWPRLSDAEHSSFLRHQRDMKAPGREEAHEPRVVVEGPEERDHEPAPREKAACHRRDDDREHRDRHDEDVRRGPVLDLAEEIYGRTYVSV